MFSGRFTLPVVLTILSLAALTTRALATEGTSAQTARRAIDLDGAWEISLDKGVQKCRLLLRAQQSDKGDYFLGMPPACRHSMPDLEKIGRWTMPDASHVTLNEPAGTTVVELAGAGGELTGKLGNRVYRLKRVAESGRSAAALKPIADEPKAADPATIQIANRSKAATEEARETKGDLAGRYAVMRDKRDTGCMLTLDQTRTKGSTRAHLAPGCRDQGIVIFDPSAWQIVKGELVLTARAGHKAHLLKTEDGAWAKDPKDGGKPLGLKKL